MIVARWTIEILFGHKQEALSLMKRWVAEIAPQAGFPAKGMRMLSNSIGGSEAAVCFETELEGLGQLEAAWEKLGKLEAHLAHAKQLTPFVVSGSNRWEIWRVL